MIFKNRTIFILSLILIVAAAFMWQTARQDSAIMDELAHIPASYSYVKFLDYRLNPEHPPLVKIISGLPLLFTKLNFPLASPAWTDEVNGQWQTGAQFLYESGNNADEIILLSRIGPILITLLLIALVYIWSRKLLGKTWALLPTILTAFSPTILAHGHYVTTDVGAAAGVFAATFAFINFLLRPSKKNLIFSGLALGLAQLTKFSAVLLIPYFLILISVFYLASVIKDWNTTEPSVRKKRFGIRFIRYFRAVFIIFIIAYLLVYAIYAILTINYPVQKQVADTKFILESFGIRPLAYLNIWMAGNKILRPLAEYLLGVLMVIQRSSGGNTAYFLGNVSTGGWWYYFPVVFGLKEALPALILIALGAYLSAARIIKKIKEFPTLQKIKNNFLDYLSLDFPEFSMLIFIVFYWLYSINSPLNIGVRHIIPTLPFIYILTASSLKRWVNPEPSMFNLAFIWFLSTLKNLLRSSLKAVLIVFALVWLILETVIAYPYFLSYFNEIGGGTFGGYKYVTDSNYDWGQDLKRLAVFVEKEAIEKIAVDYFGGGKPDYYLGGKTDYWQSGRGNPADIGINWLAISVNTIQTDKEYEWLRELKPNYRAGSSIFVYKF